MSEYVVIGPNAWGRDSSEYSAVSNMLSNLPRRAREAEEVSTTIYRLEDDVDWELSGMGYFRVEDEDGIVSQKELKLDGDLVRKICELSGQVELTVEEALVEADEVGDS